MKKLSLGLSLLLLLASCSHSSQPEISNVTDETIPIDEEQVNNAPKSMYVDANHFHFIVDWLSNEEVVYITKEDDLYIINAFNIETSKHRTVFKDSENIVDVLVHPSKDFLLIHTADSSTAAQIKIISMDGKKINEFSIASSEVEIIWNDLDPGLVLLTAFEEDWTYANYIYNGVTDKLETVDLLDPFPKWLGVDKVVSIVNREPSTNKGELAVTHIETQQSESFSQENVIYFDTFEDNLLTVQRVEGEGDIYSIHQMPGELLSTWTMPVDTYDEEYIFPAIKWLSETAILMTSNSYSDQPSDTEGSFQLVHIEDGKAQLIIEDLDAPSLRCSPDGSKCLTGYAFDKMIKPEQNELIDWIIMK